MMKTICTGVLMFAAMSASTFAQSDAERGQKVYATQKCVACHSIAGVGNKRGALDGVASKLSADQIRQWIPGRYIVLGTDGYGRSDSRAQLRRHFEVDAQHIVLASLRALADEGKLDIATVKSAMKKFDIDPQRPNPVTQ